MTINILKSKMSNINENIIQNPLIQYIPPNNSLYARSCIKTEIEISNNYKDNRITTCIEEGITSKSQKNDKYLKKSISNLNNDVLKKLFDKYNNEKKELNYKESIRNVNDSTIENKIELLKFLIGSLKDKFKNIDINIYLIDSSEFKLYIDNIDAVLHNESYVYIQISIDSSNGTFVECIGFNLIHNKLDDVYKKIDGIINNFQEKIADISLTSPHSSSTMPVILDPLLAGVFIHEIYGHSLEADNTLSNIHNNKLKINSNLEIKDSAILPSGIVNYQFDDEGIPAIENVLVKNGKILNLIHDRESSGCIGYSPTGNGRSETYSSDILPRMTNIILSKGDWNLEEVISDIKNGYYAIGFMGGGHNPLYDNFSISPQLCFKIVKGKIEGILKNVYITGNIKNTLKDIEAIGNKQETIASICYKKKQSVPVGIVSPFLKIKKMNLLCNY